MKELIFISSVQKELTDERRAIRDFIRGDVLLSQYFDVFLFEDLPANNQTPGQLYMAELDRAAVYIGIFADQYGWEDDEGLSPTEREFDLATRRKKARMVFVKGAEDSHRHKKMTALIHKAERQLTRRRFIDSADLTGKIYASLIRYLSQRGLLAHRPFHAATCDGATLRDISVQMVASFIRQARAERQLALSEKSAPKDALTRLNLLAEGKPTNAAVLLFGSDPQRFLPAAEVKCLHFHGVSLVKPIPSYKVFKGTLFAQVDEAVDFVMSKLNRAVGTRAAGPAAPVDYEIPRHVVAEAIVNAVAHRDYANAAAIQIYVFADRVEVWNPGELPPSLTPESLRQQHPSIPRNPLIAESLFLAHYIEKVGSGTLDVIAGCQEAELPEPEFLQEGDHFVLRIWRDWLTEELVTGLSLNARQIKALAQIKIQRRITNRQYSQIAGTIARTASRDLDDLVGKGVLQKVGTTGRSAYYALLAKQDMNETNETSTSAKRDTNRTNRTAAKKKPGKGRQ